MHPTPSREQTMELAVAGVEWSWSRRDGGTAMSGGGFKQDLCVPLVVSCLLDLFK